MGPGVEVLYGAAVDGMDGTPIVGKTPPVTTGCRVPTAPRVGKEIFGRGRLITPVELSKPYAKTAIRMRTRISAQPLVFMEAIITHGRNPGKIYLLLVEDL